MGLPNTADSLSVYKQYEHQDIVTTIIKVKLDLHKVTIHVAHLWITSCKYRHSPTS